MDKHIQLSAILNIVYRSFGILGGLVLMLLSGFFTRLMEWLVNTGKMRAHEVPMELLDIIPVILCVIGFIILVMSILGIIAAIGVMKRREWARILLLVLSFFTLLKIPLGTLLGAYTIWVMLNDEVIKAFNPPRS